MKWQLLARVFGIKMVEKADDHLIISYPWYFSARVKREAARGTLDNIRLRFPTINARMSTAGSLVRIDWDKP